MSNDLYWKETPKENQQEGNFISKSTWYFLTEYFSLEYREEIDGKILKKEDINILEAIRITAKASENHSLETDIKSIISGIEKFDSITLYYQG